MDNLELIKRAKKKVKDKKHFYAHLNAFCFVSIFLFLINCVVIPGTWWFVLPIIGWAMAVLGHYLNVFGLTSFKDMDWEKAQLEVEYEKLEQAQIKHYQKDDNEMLDISDDKLQLVELEKLKEKGNTYNSDNFV